MSYFDQGRYEEAAAQFREAYQLSGRAHLLLNVSRALELSMRPGEAADVLEEYLRAEPGAADRVTLEGRIAQLRARAAASDPGGGGDRAPTPEAPAGAGPDLVGPVVLLAGAGATLVAGVVTGLVALDLHNSVAARCDDGGVCPPDARADIDTGAALALTSDVLFGVTGALAAGGLVWLIVALADGGDQEAAQAGLACDAAGCVGSVRGTF